MDINKLAVGVDIGGTNTIFGLVDRDGNLYGEGSILTCKHGSNLGMYLEDLANGIKSLIESIEDKEIVGIGIGAPNANYYTGTINKSANLPWKEPVYLQKELMQRLGMPAIITNDANAAAIGEMIYGGARGMRDFIVITLGTGLGSGIVVNGELVYGHDGFAGELGHVVVTENGRECGCGRLGCLETYASATGIKRTVFKLMADSIHNSSFKDNSFNNLTAKMITDAVNEQDPLAIEAYRYTGEILGKALANAVTVTSPEAIFLFGGLAKAGPYIFEPTQKSMEENMLFSFKNKIKLLPSQIHDKNAAVLGASALAWQEYEKKI